MNDSIKRIRRVTALVLAVASLSAGQTAAVDRSRARGEVDRKRLVADNTRFAFDLYQNLRSRQGNLFFSPFSLSEILAMTFAGAAGETERQMRQTLRFTLPPERLHGTFRSLRQGLTSHRGEGLTIDMVHALWGQRDIRFLTSFLGTLAESYGAAPQAIDFHTDPEEARRIINRWVSDRFGGRIEGLLPSGVLSRLTRLVLVQAIDFRGAWKHGFDPDATGPGRFTRLDGSRVEVPMMAQVARLRHHQGQGYRIVELPYPDERVAMLVIVPDPGEFARVEQALDAEEIARMVAPIEVAEIRLVMPRFHGESTFRLKQTLSAMGMPLAFSDRADFSSINGHRDLLLEDVVHQAVVAVDEEGTEASTASGAVIRRKGGPPPWIIDRPFLFLVRDQETGTILLMGRVMDPSV